MGPVSRLGPSLLANAGLSYSAARQGDGDDDEGGAQEGDRILLEYEVMRRFPWSSWRSRSRIAGSRRNSRTMHTRWWVGGCGADVGGGDHWGIYFGKRSEESGPLLQGPLEWEARKLLEKLAS